MWIIKLAWRNLWRNRSRTLISVAAVFFAVVLSTIAESLKQGVFENLVKNVVSFYTGYIQVHKMGYQQEQILDNSFEDESRIKDAIKSSNNIRVFAPRLEGFALASSEALTKGCLIIGVDPALENNITGLKARLVNGVYLNNRDTGVMLSEGLAKRLKISLQEVYYANTTRLLSQLNMGKADGSSIKELSRLEKQDLLILDDFGIQPFDSQSRMLLMDIIEDRHGKRSTLIAGQVPVAAWYDIIGDQTLADAILDRIVNDAHHIELKGESLRRKRKTEE